jgi:hypothetical protein
VELGTAIHLAGLEVELRPKKEAGEEIVVTLWLFPFEMFPKVKR